MNEQKIVCCKCGIIIEDELVPIHTELGDEYLCTRCARMLTEKEEEESLVNTERLRHIPWWPCRVIANMRITIPPGIQDALGLKLHDYVEVRFKFPPEKEDEEEC